MAIDDIRADIAFVKDLVGTGDSVGRKRGAIAMITGGLVFSVTSVIVWWLYGQQSEIISGWRVLGIWALASIVHAILLWLFTGSLPRPASNLAIRAMSASGRTVGFTIGAVWVAGAAATFVTQSGTVWALFPSMIVALYGCVWSMAAAVSRTQWPAYVATGAYLAAAAMGFLANRPEILLAFAACLILLATVPGIVLLRTKSA